MTETVVSPSGTYAVEADPWEARNSQWVYTPRVIELTTGKTVLALSDTRWSMDSAIWVSDSEVSLRLRKFPGDHLPLHLEVLVDSQAVLMSASDPWRPLFGASPVLRRPAC